MDRYNNRLFRQWMLRCNQWQVTNSTIEVGFQMYTCSCFHLLTGSGRIYVILCNHILIYLVIHFWLLTVHAYIHDTDKIPACMQITDKIPACMQITDKIHAYIHKTDTIHAYIHKTYQIHTYIHKTYKIHTYIHKTDKIHAYIHKTYQIHAYIH